jgi:hypothetical protein
MEENEQPPAMADEERKLLGSYLIFANGAGWEVYEDLLFTFRDFKSDTLNEELQEIPHPYREYVKMGARMVMDRITDTMKLAEEQL